MYFDCVMEKVSHQLKKPAAKTLNERWKSVEEWMRQRHLCAMLIQSQSLPAGSYASHKRTLKEKKTRASMNRIRSLFRLGILNNMQYN